MYILSYIYIIIFGVITFCYLHVVFSNTSELSKKLLKFLTANLMLSLLMLLQFFSVSIYEYNYFYDATNYLMSFIVYANVLYTISYNGLDSKEHRDYEFYNNIRKIYQIGAIFFSTIFLTNRFHELAYSYKTIYYGNIGKTVAEFHLIQYLFVFYLFSTILVNLIIKLKKSSIRTGLEVNIFLILSFLVRLVCVSTLLDYDLLQRKYNIAYIGILIEAIIFYYISFKFELNTEINKVKTHIVENMDSPIIVIRDDGKIVKYNKSALNAFPSLESRKTERFVDIKEIVKEKNFNILNENFIHVINSEDIDLFYKVSLKITKTTLNTNFYLIAFEDVTSIKTIEDDLQKLTTIDQLTGILNRQSFKSLGEDILNNAVGTNKVICIFMIDIDHFKAINDTYGHLIGDEFLISTSKILAENIVDVGHIARYGGEEFCGIITTETEDEIEPILKHIRKSVKNKKIKISDKEERSVTISIGYVKSNNKNANLDLLFRFADIALYKAKRTGRNKIVKYSSSIDAEL